MTWTQTDPNRWTFTCVSLSDLAAQWLTENGIDANTKVFVKTAALSDSQSRGWVYADEIIVGEKNARFNIEQTQAGVTPGTIVTEFSVIKNGEFIEATISAADDKCGESFTMLKAGTNAQSAVEFESVR